MQTLRSSSIRVRAVTGSTRPESNERPTSRNQGSDLGFRVQGWGVLGLNQYRSKSVHEVGSISMLVLSLCTNPLHSQNTSPRPQIDILRLRG